MNIKAMLELADHMETVREANFNMRSYGNVQSKEIDLRRNITLESRPPCGTTCCIAGEKILLDGGHMRAKTLDFFIGKVRICDEFEYASLRLGLSNPQARSLFMDFSLETPKEAAKYIRKMVSEYKKAGGV